MPYRLLVLGIVLALPLIPTFWAILDIPKRRFPSHRSKMIWFMVVATLPFFGALCYFAFMRRRTQPIDPV